MLDILMDCMTDTIRLLPFLFLTYLVMEYIEHRMSDRALHVIRKAGRMGPLFGGILGVVPQCGFSAAAAGFFSGRVISAGTLAAVFLSTSDEMLPILLSSQAAPKSVVKILVWKAVIGIAAGFCIDFLFRKFNERRIGGTIHDLCEHDHCHCEKSIVLSALTHTVEIAAFIFLISLVLNALIGWIGEDALAGFIGNQPYIGEALAALIGMIPNCAASVVITTLYLKGAMSAGAMMSGLLMGAGVGMLVLLRTNPDKKECLKLITILYVISVACGWLIQIFGITF